MAFDIITPVKLGRGGLTAVIATFYTVPTLTRAIVKTIDICNTNSVKADVTIYLVPNSGIANDGSTLIPTITIDANSVFQWAGAQVLNIGDTIQALSSIAGVTVNISGGECV